jgi:hypothetical protein
MAQDQKFWLSSVSYFIRVLSFAQCNLVHAESRQHLPSRLMRIPIGLEITAPAHVTVEHINAVLEPLGFAGMTPEEFAPLCAA